MDERNLVLGIDLGTTFSAVAKWERGAAFIIQNAVGEYTTQSVVYKNPKTGDFVVGETAYSNTIKNPANGVIGVKRMMDNGALPIQLGDTQHTPIEISALILKRLMSDTLAKIPESRAVCTVVTVPYYFKAHQCENTRSASNQAGIQCGAILQEPIAASLEYAWRLKDQGDKRENILVFDLGGGTFDLTLFSLKSDPQRLVFEVLATGGDDRLGGMDFDEALSRVILSKTEPKIDLDSLPEVQVRRAKHLLLSNARQSKHRLSVTKDDEVLIPDLVPGQSVDITITRAEFEEAIAPYVDKIETLLGDLMTTAGNAAVDRVVLVGGSSKIPAMKEVLATRFGASRIWGDTEPDFAVAKGAALYAAYIDDPSIFGREIEIKTRTCHALGVELSDGTFKPLIPANRMAPAAFKQVFNRPVDGMTALEVKVFQGSARRASDNSLVGVVNVPNLTPKPANTADGAISVTFAVDKDQSLTVTVETEGRKTVGSLSTQ